MSFDPSVNPDDTNFVVMRTSYGLMTDEKCEDFLEAIQPLPGRGAYHYFSSGSPWEDQAELFLSLTKDKGFHFFALDIDKAFNKSSMGFIQSAEKWMNFVAKETGKRVLLYTNPSVYIEWLMPFAEAEKPWMQDWPL